MNLDFFRRNVTPGYIQKKDYNNSKYSACKYSKRKKDLFKEMDKRRGLLLKGLNAIEIIKCHRLEEKVKKED